MSREKLAQRYLFRNFESPGIALKIARLHSFEIRVEFFPGEQPLAQTIPLAGPNHRWQRIRRLAKFDMEGLLRLATHIKRQAISVAMQKRKLLNHILIQFLVGKFALQKFRSSLALLSLQIVVHQIRLSQLQPDLRRENLRVRLLELQFREVA